MVNAGLFWEVKVQGVDVVVRSGHRRKGRESDVQTYTYPFPTPEAATQRATELLGAKVVNGYKILPTPHSPARPSLLSDLRLEEWIRVLPTSEMNTPYREIIEIEERKESNPGRGSYHRRY